MLRLTAVTLLLLTGGVSQDRPASDEGVVTTLTGYEKVWNDAHLRQDAGALEPLFADDITVAVPGMPEMTKSQSLGFLRSGRIKFDRYETSGIHVRAYGDAAVVTGHLTRVRTINGQAVNDDWLFTKTYVRQAGAWRVVAFHASSNN